MSATIALPSGSLFQDPPEDLYSRVAPLMDRLRAVDLSAVLGKKFAPKQVRKDQMLGSTSEAEASLLSFKRFMATQTAMGEQRIMCPSEIIDGLWHTTLGPDSRAAFDKFCVHNLGATLFHPARTDDPLAAKAFKWTKRVMVAGGTAPSRFPGQNLIAGAAGLVTGGSSSDIREDFVPKVVWQDRGCWTAEATQH